MIAHPKARFLALAFVVLGLWLGFPNKLVSLPFLVLFYPLGLALLGKTEPTPKKAFLAAWLAGSLGHVLALYWLYVPMTNVGGLPLAAAIPCALLVCVILATQAGLFALASRYFWKEEAPLTSLAMALVWYFLELGYALVAGFPWLPLSGALAPLPWSLQIADTLGATLAGALWAGCALAIGGAILAQKWQGLVAGLVCALLIGGYGMYRLPEKAQLVGPEEAAFQLPKPSEDKTVFPVLLVEGNIDQNQKWVEAFRTSTVKTYVDLSLFAVQKVRQRARSDEEKLALESYLSRGLILWPETAMPFDLARSPHTRSLMAMVIEAKMPLLTGAPGQEAGPGRTRQVYNRVWLLDANGYPAGSYDKEHLVPFGEYVPSFFRWKFLEGLLQEIGAYSEGTRTSPLRLGSLSLGPLVCYEAVFPWLAQERVARGANVLVDVSNDAWFGDTSAPWQHLALTGLRALEQNRYLVRCTNSGISAIFDNRGRLVFQGPQFQAEALWAEAATISENSLFHRYYMYIPAACGVLLALLLAVFALAGKRTNIPSQRTSSKRT